MLEHLGHLGLETMKAALETRCLHVKLCAYQHKWIHFWENQKKYWWVEVVSAVIVGHAVTTVTHLGNEKVFKILKELVKPKFKDVILFSNMQIYLQWGTLRIYN